MKLKETLIYITAWDYLDRRTKYRQQLIKRLLGDKIGRDEDLVFDLKTVAKEIVASVVSPLVVVSRFTGADLALKKVRQQLAKEE